MIPPKVFCFFNNKTSPMVYFCQKYNRYQRKLNYKCEKNLLSLNKKTKENIYPISNSRNHFLLPLQLIN